MKKGVQSLAQAANVISSMSTIFAANLRNPVLVKDGALSIGANQFSAGRKMTGL